MNLPVIPMTADERHIDQRIDYHIHELANLWAGLERDHAIRLERDELRRNILSRVKHVQDTNRVFMELRHTFSIPDDIKIADFPQWLEQAMQIQKDRMFAEWQERMARKRIAAPVEQDFEPANFLVHGSE